MASSYTTNYNLDKYVGTDKPNLRDQYNAAMDKIDNALLAANTNATEAKTATLSFQEDISDLQGQIGSGFSSSSTVANAISSETTARQNADNEIKDIIPASSFSSTNTVKQYIDNAKEDVLNSMERNAIYLGNSYSVGVGDDGTKKGVFGRTKDFLFKNAYVFADSGAGFTTYANTTQFITLLQNAINSSQFDNETITDIVIVAAAGEGMALDHAGTTTYQAALGSAMQSLTTLAYNNFPNLKKVFCVLAESQREPFHVTGGYTIDPRITPIVHAYMKHYAAVVEGFVYGGWIGWEIQFASDLFSDSIHPNTEGYRDLAAAFINAYNGNYTPSIRGQRWLESGVWGFTNLNVIMTLRSNGEQSTLTIEEFTTGGNTPVPPSGATQKFCDFNTAGGAATHRVLPAPNVSIISGNETMGAINIEFDPSNGTSARIVKAQVVYDKPNRHVYLVGVGFWPSSGYSPAPYGGGTLATAVTTNA